MQQQLIFDSHTHTAAYECLCGKPNQAGLAATETQCADRGCGLKYRISGSGVVSLKVAKFKPSVEKPYF